MRSCSVGGSAVACCVALMVAVSSRPVYAIATRTYTACDKWIDADKYCTTAAKTKYYKCVQNSRAMEDNQFSQACHDLSKQLNRFTDGYRYVVKKMTSNGYADPYTLPCHPGTVKGFTWNFDGLYGNGWDNEELWDGGTNSFKTWILLYDNFVETFGPIHYRCLLSEPKDFQDFRDLLASGAFVDSGTETTGTRVQWRIDRYLVPCTTTFVTRGETVSDHYDWPEMIKSVTKQCKRVIDACGENSNWVCDRNPTEEGFNTNSGLDIRRCCSPASSKWLALYDTTVKQVKALCGYTDGQSVHTHAPFKKDVDQAWERPVCGAGVATSVPKRVECCTGGTLWTQDTTNIKDLCYKSVAKPQDRAVAWKCHDKTPTDTYWDPWLKNANPHVLRKAHHTAKAEVCCGYVSPNKKNDDYSAGFRFDYSAGFKSTWERE